MLAEATLCIAGPMVIASCMQSLLSRKSYFIQQRHSLLKVQATIHIQLMIVIFNFFYFMLMTGQVVLKNYVPNQSPFRSTQTGRSSSAFTYSLAEHNWFGTIVSSMLWLHTTLMNFSKEVFSIITSDDIHHTTTKNPCFPETFIMVCGCTLDQARAIHLIATSKVMSFTTSTAVFQ